MTLGLFMPLVLAFGALLIVPMMLRKRGALPGSTDPGYDAELVEKQQRGYLVIAAAWVLAPVLAWIVLNVISPQDGAMVLF